MVPIFLKRTPRFKYGEAVIPNHGYFEGKVGLVSDVKRYFPFPDEYVVVFQLRIINGFVSTRDNFTKDELEKYVPKHQLIRPLRVGDYIYIANDFVAFYNETSLKYRGKKLRITEIKESPYPPSIQHYYTDTGCRWLDINLDIPLTNRLLMKQSRPKVHARLPNI